MGRQGSVGDQFRDRLRNRRETLGWSQEKLAKMLKDKGLSGVYATTIAKIEAGDRAVRVDELAGIAELFGSSVDSLLGRRDDQVRVLMAAADTAIRSSGTLIDVMSAVRDRIDDLAASEGLPARDRLIAGYQQSYSLMLDANEALTAVGSTARKTMGRQLRRTR